MQIDVEHIAKLAKLRIPPQRVQAFERDMQEIVALVQQLPPLEDGNLLDAADQMQLREDEVQPSLAREEILQNAPQQAQGCFQVPKTVE